MSENESKMLDGVPSSTLSDWRAIINLHGIIPNVWHALEDKEKKKKDMKPSKLMDDDTIKALKKISMDHPSYFLDEIRDELYRKTYKPVALSRISTRLRTSLGLTLQVLGSIEKRQN